MESFALHSLSTTATSTLLSHHHHHPSRLFLLRRTSSRSPPSTISLRSLSVQPLSFPLLKPIPRFSTRIAAAPQDNAPPPPPPPSPSPSPQGAKLIPLILSISVGLILRFAVPVPEGVTPQGWQLLSIFLSTIAGLVLSPLPVGAWAFIGLTASIVTKTLSFAAAFSAFTSEVIWLIVISFFFARGFVKTGLGDRIATYFVKWLGKSTLGLSYGLTLSEALIAPAMPSTTARAGGIFLPIIKSLSLSAGSKPGDSSSRKLGSYLIQSQFQVTSLIHDLAYHFLCRNMDPLAPMILRNKVCTLVQFVSYSGGSFLV